MIRDLAEAYTPRVSRPSRRGQPAFLWGVLCKVGSGLTQDLLVLEGGVMDGISKAVRLDKLSTDPVQRRLISPLVRRHGVNALPRSGQALYATVEMQQNRVIDLSIHRSRIWSVTSEHFPRSRYELPARCCATNAFISCGMRLFSCLTAASISGSCACTYDDHV